MNENATPTKNACPICDDLSIVDILKISNVPIHCNVLWSKREKALCVPKGDIDLGFCNCCGHVFNQAFDSDKIDYGQGYENSLHYSPHFQKYALSIAEKLVKTYDLYGKSIIEIGCGKGDFLDMLCGLGDNHGIGFDPSYENDRIPKAAAGRFSVIQDFYTKKYADYEANLIVCRHVLEHIKFPQVFLNMIRQNIGSTSTAVVFFEVPNVMYTLKNIGIWDLIYEHCGYYSVSSLSYLFSSCNLNPINILEAFDSQYLCIEARPGDKHSSLNEIRECNTHGMINYINYFSDLYYRKVNEWRGKIEKLIEQHQKVVVWGAGSKGVTFLNTLENQDQIKYVVDINPHKQGKFVAGTGQEIVPPEFLQKLQPDVVILMNSVYMKEVRSIAESLGLETKFLYA
jgi:SAM-dependent methyltransferase